MATKTEPPSAEISVFTSSKGETAVRTAYQTVMDAWMPGSEELFIPTDFGLTHVIADGPEDAPPLVLLHALFATSTSWYRNIPRLSGQYRTYCVDVLGEANLSRPTKPMSSLDDFLAWFTGLLEGLRIDAFSLIGNSYGGFTAAHYAMRLGSRVEKLVLIGPAATIAPMRPFMRHMFYPKGLYLLLPWAPGLKRTMRNSIEWMHQGLPTDPLWEPLFYETMVHGKLINRVFPRTYTAEELEAITADVLLIVGENEAIYDNLSSALSEARQLIPKIEVSVVPHAHHIAALSQPEISNERILDFLSD